MGVNVGVGVRVGVRVRVGDAVAVDVAVEVGGLRRPAAPQLIRPGRSIKQQMQRKARRK